MMKLLMVFIGGGLGSMVRYLIARSFVKTAASFPYGTLVANTLSCIILGIFMGLIALNAHAVNDKIKLLIMVGFCGGFSTYSTFTSETFLLLENGNWWLGMANIIGNLIICMVAIMIGMAIGKSFL